MAKINGVTSEKMLEIQKRLQSQENQKARKLLETAMSHMQALDIVTNHIIKQIENGTKPKQ